jgi:hypothetical protein
MNSASLFGSEKPIEDRFRPDADIVIFPGDVSQFLGQIPDRSIALIVTSPPYNLRPRSQDESIHMKHPIYDRCLLFENPGPPVGVGSGRCESRPPPALSSIPDSTRLPRKGGKVIRAQPRVMLAPQSLCEAESVRPAKHARTIPPYQP